MRKNFFFALASGFVLGIYFGTTYPYSLGIIGFIFLLCSLFLAAIVFLRYRETSLWLVVILIGIIVGTVHGSMNELSPPQTALDLLGTEQVLQGRVVAEPDIRETAQHLTVEIKKETATAKVLVTAPLFPPVHYGDMVLVSGRVERPQQFETNGGRVFRYDMFLAKDGIFLVVRNASVSVYATEKDLISSAARGLFFLKHYFVSLLAQSLPEPESALAEGMLVGGKQGLGEKLIEVFTVTGLVHIVVLSGYNVMILAEAARTSLSFLPKSFALGGAGTLVFFFVLVSGAGAASVRAGLMAIVGLFARATGRTYDATRALVFVGVGMLILNPLLLLHDPGFQLSFVATLGLILGAPVVEKWLVFCKNTFVRELLASTISAQVAVLPLLLFQTGILSFVSLPANILVLPLVPLAMATAAFAAVASFCISPLAPLFGFPAFSILYVVISIAEFFASVPFAYLTVPVFGVEIVLGAYALLGTWYWWITKQNSSVTRRHSN